uniref:DUF1985 domain-containing protein n=1 Tax=Brassica campestris TaxID=3711 RepID=A0A3P5ZQU2_BRACM|nr:unnamed protein product [Brassica rapa]
MPGKKKLQLALIIIVDGVLIAHQQTPRPTLKYVRMVQDVDTFCSHHPWGRVFYQDHCRMKPPVRPKKMSGPNRSNGSAPQGESLRLRGFPLHYNSLHTKAIPKLQSTIPIPFDSRDNHGPRRP